MQGSPMVSVAIITYNHERYIRETIHSILNQETAFDFEVVISNDRSPDNTDRVIRECIAEHPKGDLVRYFNQEKNLGPQPNSAFVREQCRGKYIAPCEGDDYWTDNAKLQKQVDFLESHPDFSLCFHNAYLVDETGTRSEEKLFRKYTKDIYTIEDVLADWLIPTASIMYRNSFLPPLPDWYFRAPVGDVPVFAMLAARGPMKLLPGVMSAYRIHAGGVTAKNDFAFWDKLLLMHDNLDKYLGPRYHSLFELVRADLNYQIIKHALGVKEHCRLPAARQEILAYIKKGGAIKKRHLKAIAASLFPLLSKRFQ